MLILNTTLRKGGLLIGPEDIVRRYGVMPAQWCYYRALTGNSFDDLTGVPGIGPHMAARLPARRTALEDHKGLGRLRGRTGEMLRDHDGRRGPATSFTDGDSRRDGASVRSY